MSSTADQLSLVLIRRLADGTNEWIDLEVPQRVPAAPGAAYALIDRTDYEAPQTLVVTRQGEDLIVEVSDAQVLVLGGFFATLDAAFHPTTDVASGAGPFSGSPVTPDTPILATAEGKQVVWSAQPIDQTPPIATIDQPDPVGGGNTPMILGGLAAGGLGLALLGGGGGGGGGGSSLPADTTAPRVTSGPDAPAIDENSGSGQIVYTATATDASAISWSLAASGDSAAFNINPSTGAVTLISNPDFESQPSYAFTVVATDAAGNSSQQAVTLAINDLDDTAPTITSGGTATAIDENSGTDQVVYTATATNDVTVTWNLAATGDGAKFSIDANSGVVTLTDDPDFETQPSYTFTVVATDDIGNSSQQAVTLAINDLDENDPIITSGGTATAIDENSGAGQVVYTATATDESPVAWSLATSGDADAFSIDVDTGAVTLINNPDFETQDSYAFTVVATDAAGNSSQQAVSLGIIDQDDFAPFINSGAIATAIDENSGAGQEIYTATAIDDGTVTWSLADSDDGAAFSIDPNSGVVALTDDPDFETQPSYTFTVVATDDAGNISQQAVTLAINDLDEIAPTVSSVALTSATGATNDTLNDGDTVSVTVTMTEDVNVNTAGGTPRVALSIGGTTAFASFVSGSGSNSLVFAYTVQSGDTDTNGIAIPTNALELNGGTITDVADNAADLDHDSVANNPSYLVDTTDPNITSDTTAPAINENVAAGQTVYTAIATDVSAVTWSLAGSDDDADFSINANSGVVTLDISPNFEDQESYTFNVVATDAAGNSNQQAVTLAINDLDEIAPTVSSVALTSATGAQNNTLNDGDTVSVTVTMTENVTVNTTGGTPSVELDIGGTTAFASFVSGSGSSNLVFTYTVQPGDTDTNGIRIPNNALELNGGVITDASGNTANIAHGPVPNNPSYLVDTTDPSITSDTTAPAIDENVATGQTVYTAIATDVSAVTWSLAGSDDDADFSINANSGVVTLDISPNFEDQNSYTFNVVATDAAGNSDQQAVTLAINDLDENAPTVSSVALTSATGAQNNTLNDGDTVSVTVTMTENVTVNTAGGTPRVELNIGGSTAFASFVSGSGSNSLVFAYTVQSGDTDTNGIAIPTNALELNGGAITDAADNAADLDHDSVPANNLYLVDTTDPTLTSSTPADEATAVLVGDDIVLNFSENVLAGSGSITISDGIGDSRTIGVNSTQVSISGNQVTINPTDDLNAGSTYNVQIASGALTDSAGNDYAGINNSTTLNFDTEPGVDTSIVVFDLVDGMSSDHSGRTFQSGVSYDIYIRVDSTSASLNTTPELDAPGTWGTWSGTANLGSDDRIILVGDGSPVDGPTGAVTQVSFNPGSIAWQSSASGDAGRVDNSSFARTVGVSTDSTNLFGAALPSVSFVTTNVYFTDMPGGILTSQGLA